MGRSEEQRGGRAFRYALLALGVVVMAVAGYAGYVAYPRFGLPPAEGAAVLALAAAAGVAAFFSPCSFPLLVTLLAREARPGRALRFAAPLAAGAAAFLLLAGVVISAAGRGLFASVTFTSPAGRTIRIAVGVILIVLGLIQARILHAEFHAVTRFVEPAIGRAAALRRRHPVAGVAVYGFFYLLAGFG